SYEADELTMIADYALGYQVLKNIDPDTASNYADKAIGIMKSGLHDNQRTIISSRQFLARGDGTTVSFVLPNADVIPSTLKSWLPAVQSKAIVHYAKGSADQVDLYNDFLKVSNTPDGPADYKLGTDWRRNDTLVDNTIDWSQAVSEPAVGATYYVTEASSLAT